MRSSQPTLCYITDRHAVPSDDVLSVIIAAIEAGVDLIQIRERDLGTRELLWLVGAAVEGIRSDSGKPLTAVTRVVVNDRLDVALAAGAHGVHLGGQSLPVETVRTAVPAGKDFVVGVSCHSQEDVTAAEAAGAEYAILGPIFETASKLRYGPPLGLGVLERAASQAHIPVLALGGVTPQRVQPCIAAGAAGIAGVSIFQQCPSLPERVRELRGLLGTIIS